MGPCSRPVVGSRDGSGMPAMAACTVRDHGIRPFGSKALLERPCVSSCRFPLWFEALSPESESWDVGFRR